MWAPVMILLSFGVIHCHRIQLSCEQIRHFVDGHNFRRQTVAKGLVPGQPAANNMMYMVWDEELAEKAARWAENGLFSHNPDRTVGSQRWSLIGENLFINYFYSSLNIPVIPNIEQALNSWYTEYTCYNFEPYALETDCKSGHYTQMVWADTTRVGCGISQMKQNGWTNTLFVCDYGPGGNFIGKTPYNSSIWAGYLQCNKGECDKPYGTYCSNSLLTNLQY